MTLVKPFTYTTLPARILFGVGIVSRLLDEVEALGCRRILLLSTDVQRGSAEAIAARLGGRVAGLFDGAVMHTPTDVTERVAAMYGELKTDALLAFGGGSTIGLAKAVALRTGAPQIVLPTTYAGSEVTPLLGQTENGLKTTIRDARLLPGLVLYDPELTLTLPVAMSVTSGLNAMAHAIEGFYSAEANFVSSAMAEEGVRALHAALPTIVQSPQDIAARAEALYGSWLCGSVLGAVGMSLHHKLCHTLGGSFSLPHAETHAVVLPHAVAFNAHAAAHAMAPLIPLFGENFAAGLWSFSQSLGAPTSLRALGLEESDLDRAADLAVAHPYANPRPVERGPIRDLLQRAWAGEPPRTDRNSE
jgi:maleylacetate reductase